MIRQLRMQLGLNENWVETYSSSGEKRLSLGVNLVQAE